MGKYDSRHMSETSKPSLSKLLVYLLFLVLPTIAVLYLGIDNVTGTLSFLKRDVKNEIILIAIGTALAFSIHYFRVRAWITFIPLLILVYSGSKLIEQYYPGEFDSYYITIQFQHYAGIFVFAWFMGYCLARFRYFPHVLAAASLIVGIIVLSSLKEINIQQLIQQSAFVLVYAFYMIYTREYLEDLKELSFKKFAGLVFRLAVFILLNIITFYGITRLMKDTISAYEKDIASAKSKEGNGGSSSGSKDKILKKNDDGTFDINEIAKLDRRQNTATGNGMQELLFVTYLDNFMMGTDNIPVPYYYVSYYLNKYDVHKEQFVKDAYAPMSDNFTPMPQQLPMLISLTDTAVLGQVQKLKLRTTKEVLIYTDKLNPNHFTAPATAYAVEPIPVDPDFKDKYKFAYRAKSYVSQLNEAFYVYNHPHPVIQQFNEQRHNFLKEVKGYSGVDPAFMKYYTEMPKTTLHDSIALLAKEVTKGAVTPIDKVKRVRNFFKEKSPDGKPIFKYTLEVMKPSEPNIPNQKMLSNFLFKTHKGYCTYYAASSLFMLRSLGIPVRFTAGFLIEDRSAGKNQGWYTVYGSQAHAWIQVYFPEYGWLDFDTTIPEVAEQQNAPKPDGTPPLTIPKVYFSGYGKITKIDTAQKTAVLQLQDVNFRNREYAFKNKPSITIDLKKAQIFKNKDHGKLSDLKDSMEISAVVYANIFQKVNLPEEYESGAAFAAALPKPMPVDEVHIKIKPEPKKPEPTEKAQAPKYDWTGLILTILLVIGIVLLVVGLLLPTLVYLYYKVKANTTQNNEKKAYYIHMLALYIFNQLGYYRGSKTTLHYASQVIDPVFGIGYQKFVNVYLKLKYSNQILNNQDLLVINEFHPYFVKQVFAKVGTGKVLKAFFNYVMLQKFFTLPEEE